MTTPGKSGPLLGLRVIEMAGIGPGPFAAMLLADLGADVLRIDRPGPSALPVADVLSRGRRSAVLDLKQEGALDVLLQLVERADVLLEGYRPGVAERLGFGPDVCLERNPRLVYGRMTGWGQDGPLAQAAGHDISYIAHTGALHAMGRADGPPQVPLNLIGDFGGGSMYLAFGVCAALWERERSGAGQVIDAAIVDGTASLMTMPFALMSAGVWRDERGVNLLDTGEPYYDVYETADAKWMAVGALEPQFYAEFVRLLGASDLPDRHDSANRDALRKRIATRFRERTRDEWAETFVGSDACVAPVLTMREAAQDAHLSARGTYVERHGVMQPAPAPRFSRTPGALHEPPPARGQHTVEALADWGIADPGALVAAGIAVQN